MNKLPRITFVALGSQGSFGHLAIFAELARLSAHFCGSGMGLITEQQYIPQYFLRNATNITLIETRTHKCSRGGALNVAYQGADVDAALHKHRDSVLVFSTFFDPQMVVAARKNGCHCVWMSHPIRESFWQLFVVESYRDLFDQLVILDDIIEPNRLGLSWNDTYTLVPPPQFQFASNNYSFGSVGKLKKIVVSCGGGLVNGSDDLFFSSIESLVKNCNGNHELKVALGAISPDAFQARYPSIEQIPATKMRDEMKTADLLVCQAGYNTIIEALFDSVPLVVVPAPRMIDDQELRAVLLYKYTRNPVILPSHIEDVGLSAADVLSNRQDHSEALTSYVNQRGWNRPSNTWANLFATWKHYN